MIDIPMNADYHKQRDRHGESEYAPCIVCGRAVKNQKHFLRVFYGGVAVMSAEADEIIAREGDGGDLLYYPVGSDCLRNHPELKPYVDDAVKARANASATGGAA